MTTVAGWDEDVGNRVGDDPRLVNDQGARRRSPPIDRTIMNVHIEPGPRCRPRDDRYAPHRSAGFVCNDCFRLIGSKRPIGEIRSRIRCMSKNQIRRERKSVFSSRRDPHVLATHRYNFLTIYNYAIKSCCKVWRCLCNCFSNIVQVTVR